MAKPRNPMPLNAQIRAQATDWLLRFSEGEVDTGGREDFVRWLRASPEHVRAYLRVCAFWQDAPHVQGTLPSDVGTLIELASREPNIIALEPSLGSQGAHAQSRSGESSGLIQRMRASRGPLLALAAGILVAAFGLGIWLYSQRGLYVTDTGEQRTVNLSDGSTVIINAHSRVKVTLTDAVRNVELLDGQALFKVAKNTERPFIVHSNGTLVRAVGTQFDVYRKTTSTVVTVVEGKVDVASTSREGGASVPPLPVTPKQPGLVSVPQANLTPRPPARELLLAAGEQAIVTGHVVTKPRNPNIAAATAWTTGLLVFDAAPLDEVVQEFNRQNARIIVLLGPDLRDLKISGSFPASGNERIVRFLQERFHVEVHETEDEIRISRP